LISPKLVCSVTDMIYTAHAYAAAPGLGSGSRIL
jgi:hypothetical protein